MSIYRMYIDESGDHVMMNDAALLRDSHRYFALVGCWMTRSVYTAFNDAMEELKRKHFAHDVDNPVVLHREEIIRCSGSFFKLRDQNNRDAFDNDLLGLIKTTDFKVCGVIVDKYQHKSQYMTPFHVYHMALDFLLQRYCGFLNHKCRQGDVMAESRGGKEDVQLGKAFFNIYANGDNLRDAEFYQRALTSKKIKLKKKEHNVCGLQLVDILANPLRRYVLLKCQRVEAQPTSYESRVFELLRTKFNQNTHSGKVEGYGWLIFPRK